MNEYEPCECGEECALRDWDKAGECWGTVYLIDETYNEETGDCSRIHVCEAHEEMFFGKEYIPKPQEDQ